MLSLNDFFSNHVNWTRIIIIMLVGVAGSWYIAGLIYDYIIKPLYKKLKKGGAKK